MIRFTADTWRDAIFRPLAMAFPDGGVYVEIMAPDFRFVYVLALLLVWALLRLRGMRMPQPVALLLLLTTLAFFPWMATTGNGRYFIPFLLTIGVLAMALVHHLPITKTARIVMAVVLVGLQAFAIQTSNPWKWWGLVPWSEAPFFEVELDAPARETPSTYVTISSISYSLLAPRFHPDSRWINLTGIQSLDNRDKDWQRAHALMRNSAQLDLLIPSLSGHVEADGKPDLAFVAAINQLLDASSLTVRPDASCRLLRSKGLSTFGAKTLANPDDTALSGFWICPLRYIADRPANAEPRVFPADRVFAKVESMCPRFFPPGGAATQLIPSGSYRHYASTDFKVYVFDNGSVMLKYWRALNFEQIGSAADVLAGKASLDCNNIRGRSGLPWERQI